MAVYADESDAWKCSSHPSRRRPIGVCAPCLRDKLSALCPDCATLRPCACSLSASSSSSSGASVARLSNFVNVEPMFQRSRSVAFPFFKSVRRSNAESVDGASIERRRSSIWMYLWPKRGKNREEDKEAVVVDVPAIARSKSEARAVKGRGWYFISPLKVFRRSPFLRG